MWKSGLPIRFPISSLFCTKIHWAVGVALVRILVCIPGEIRAFRYRCNLGSPEVIIDAEQEILGSGDDYDLPGHPMTRGDRKYARTIREGAHGEVETVGNITGGRIDRSRYYVSKCPSSWYFIRWPVRILCGCVWRCVFLVGYSVGIPLGWENS